MTDRTKFTQEIADVICRRLADGESLTKICKEEGMPDRHTVREWRGRNEAFDSQYMRAREDQADFLFDICKDIADASKKDTAHADRVKIDTYKWIAGKLRPKVYGEKSIVEMTGKDGGPIKTTDGIDLSKLSTDELRNLVALSARASLKVV